jgi:uncharacterized protein YggE
MKIALSYIVALSTSLAACHDRPQVIAVQGTPNDPTTHPGQMTVTGSAKLEVSPDCADLTMTVTAENARPGIATHRAQDDKAAVIAKLRELGIDSKDMKLSSLQLEPLYAPRVVDAERMPKLQGYRASITVTATTHDFAKLPAMMEAGADAGVTQMTSQFRRSDLDKLKREVRELAIAAAKAKADQTAHALGIHLGRITSVAENAGGAMWRQEYFPQMTENMVATQAAGDAALGGSLQPLALDITVGYELAGET